MKPKKRTKPPPQKRSAMYLRLWRIVDGATAEAFDAHPDYLTEKGRRYKAARNSIAKRAVGELESFVAKVTGDRSGKNGG